MTNIDILLVEDNPGDILMTQEAFREAKVTNALHVVRDGEEALSFLHKRGPYSAAATPDIILLDLNLPKLDGREVLDEIKNDEALCRIPVIILTSSEAESDILDTYRLHVNCYIVKPVDFEAFLIVARRINDFWLTLVKLPSSFSPRTH